MAIASLGKINNKLYALCEKGRASNNAVEWNRLRKDFVAVDMLFHRVAISLGHLGRIPDEYLSYIKSRLLIMNSGIRTGMDMRCVYQEHEAITRALSARDVHGVRVAIETHLASARLRWGSTGDYVYYVSVVPTKAASHAWNVDGVEGDLRGTGTAPTPRFGLENREELWDDEFCHPEMYRKTE